MYCSKCEAPIAGEDKFCSKCGASTSALSIDSGAQLATQFALTQDKPSGTEIKPFPKKESVYTSRRGLVIGFLVFVVFATIMNVLLPSFSGRTPEGRDTIYIVLMWGLAFWFYWKLRNRKPLIGAVIGVLISILIIASSLSIAGYTRGQEKTIVAVTETPPLPSIKKNFPNEYSVFYEELVNANKSRTLTKEDIVTLLLKRVAPLISKALKTTSDPALLQFAEAKLHTYRDIAKRNASDCYKVISGEISAAPTEEQFRSNNAISEESKNLVRESIIKVLNDAGTTQELSNGTAIDNRFNMLYEKIDAIIKRKYSFSAYDYGDDSSGKTMELRCKAGLALFEETMNLPPTDRAFMLRRFYAGQ